MDAFSGEEQHIRLDDFRFIYLMTIEGFTPLFRLPYIPPKKLEFIITKGFKTADLDHKGKLRDTM